MHERKEVWKGEFKFTVKEKEKMQRWRAKHFIKSVLHEFMFELENKLYLFLIKYNTILIK